MKRVALILLVLLLVLAGAAVAEGEITSKAQLNQPGMRVGVGTGTTAAMMVEQEFPNAELVYLEGADGYEAVALGRIDAYVYERQQMELAIASGRKGVHLLDENMEGAVSIAVGISPASKTPDLEQNINAFIAATKADGTLDDMFRRWVTDSDLTMPDIDMPTDPKLHIIVGTTGTVPPFSFYSGDELVGYDIEMARRFAAWMNADVSFKVYDYGAIIIAAKTGDVDLIMANLNVTPERAEALTFSDALYTLPVGIMVKGDPKPDAALAGGYNAIDELDGKRIGVQTGTTFDGIVQSALPNAQIMYFNTKADLINGIKANKIDAYAVDEPVLKSQMSTDDSIVSVPGYLESFEFGFVFPKTDAGQILRGQFDEYLGRIKANGTLEAIEQKWISDGSDIESLDYESLPADNGRLTLATEALYEPFAYIQNNAIVGYDIEIATGFCREYGYALDIIDMSFDGILPSVVSGKCDFGCSGIAITPERAESVLFSEPYYTGGTVLAVLKSEVASTQKASGGVITSLDELDGRRIGVQTGTTAADITLARLPHAQISYFSTFPDMAVALKTRKIDGFPGDGLVLRQMAHEDPSLRLLDEKLRSYDCGFVLPKDEKGEALCAEMNAWIKDMREKGELDRILKKWTEAPEAERTVPDYKSLPAPKGVLTMTTEGTFPPMNYYRGDECVGMEIEMCALFCEANGYGLNVTTMDFDGMLAAVQARKVDFAISGIAITEERKESVLFSDPYYTGGTMMAVLGSDANAPADGDLPSLERLSGRRAVVQTGTISGEVAQSVLPDIEVGYYNTQTDCMAALRTQKVDFWATDEPIARFMLISNDDLQIAGSFDSSAIAAVFPKSDAGQALRDQYSAFVDELWENGTMDKIDGVWFGTDEDKKIVQDYETLPDTNGTLRMAADTTLPPFVYVKDNRPVGYDVDIAARFCAANGYRLEVVPMDFGGVLPAVQTGKCDFAACCITVTEERAQSVLFSAPTYHSGTVAVVRAETIAAGASTNDGQSGIAASFHKTFIREDRWKLFVRGVITTLVITLLSILFGTLLGFAIFMMCRNGNPFANGITRFCLWLVQGMPMVVLLMILYYIIFGSVSISGIVVAVVGFTLTFGAAVFGLLKMGVGAVDNGQYEAAYALGYSNRRTFFKIILPQALPHVMPAYKGEIVGLIKATAIVGYIAVQDLTKMGDIVRSRTYEAFFPLIAITIIYFVLEGLIGLVVSRIGTNINPKKRSRESILKGVKTDD